MKALGFYLSFIATSGIAMWLAKNNLLIAAGSGQEASLVNMGLWLLLCESVLCMVLWFGIFRWKRMKDCWWTRKHLASANSSAHTKEHHSMRLLRPFRTLLFAVLATTLVSFGLSLVLEPLQLSDNGVTAYFNTLLQQPWSLLLLVVVGPLCEELVFRAGIQQSLRNSGLHPLLAAVVSASAFALVHGNLAQGIPAFTVGILLGILYNCTGNLWLCLPAHMANNLLAVGLMAMGSRFDLAERWPVWAVVALGIFHIGLGLRNLQRTLRQPVGTYDVADNAR